MNSNGTGNNPITAQLLRYYNSTTSSDAQLYAMFHDDGPTPVLILPALVLSLIGLIGIPLNVGIVYTTIKHRKTLNRNANYLIAINAFFDTLQLLHPFPFLFIALSGQNFVGTFQSFRLIIPSLFGIQCSLTCIACTGVDRLLSVLLPIHYHKMNTGERQLYCGFHTFLCVANGIWNVAGLWVKCAAEADKPVTGFIGQIGWDSSKDFLHYLVGPLLIWITIGCYFAIGAVLLIQKKRIGWTHQQQQQNGTGGLTQQQKLLKSLTVIVSVHVGTSLFGSLLLGFSFLYSTITTWYMMTLSLCIILVGACSNAIVLYMNSVEYRQLFKHGLGELKTAGQRAMGVTPPMPVSTIGVCPSYMQNNSRSPNRSSPIRSAASNHHRTTPF